MDQRVNYLINHLFALMLLVEQHSFDFIKVLSHRQEEWILREHLAVLGGPQSHC